MSEEAMEWLDSLIKGLGISCAAGLWREDPVPDPYWVMEKSEDPPGSEDGLQEYRDFHPGIFCFSVRRQKMFTERCNFCRRITGF